MSKHRQQAVCTRFTADQSSSGDLGESNSGYVVDKQQVELGRVEVEEVDKQVDLGRVEVDKQQVELGRVEVEVVDKQQVELRRVEGAADIRWSRTHSHTAPGRNTAPAGL